MAFDGWKSGVRAGMVACAVVLMPAIAVGADKDESAAERVVVVSPRAEARIGNQEVIIEYIDRKLLVFLQRYVDGVPTTGAKIEVTADFVPGDLEEIAPGVYSGDDWSLAGGKNDIELSITMGEQVQHAVVPLVIASNRPQAAGVPMPISGTVPAGVVPGSVLAAAAIATYVIVSLLFLRHSRRKATTGA